MRVFLGIIIGVFLDIFINKIIDWINNRKSNDVKEEKDFSNFTDLDLIEELRKRQMP